MKKTMGAIASDLLNKESSNDISPIEVQKAQEKEYLDNLTWCVQHALKKVDCSKIEGHDICKDREPLHGDFFIVVLLKKERLLENVLRNYFIATKACPTPHYDQTVYRYDHKNQDIEFIWVVPDEETCGRFKQDANIVVPEERGLLKQVLDYFDGTLYIKMKKLNGEAMHVGVELEKVN